MKYVIVEAHLYNTVSENNIGVLKCQIIFCALLKSLILQNCERNIGLFSTASQIVIVLPTLHKQNLSLLICLHYFCIGFMHFSWLQIVIALPTIATAIVVALSLSKQKLSKED